MLDLIGLCRAVALFLQKKIGEGRRYRGGERGRWNDDDHHDGSCRVGNWDNVSANRVEVYALHYPSVMFHHPIVLGGQG